MRFYSGVLCVLAVAFCGIGCGADGTTDEGWVSLFNGKDLTGWVVKCHPKDKEKQFWKVDGGAITANSMGQKGHDYVWLQTEKEYDDFEMAFRFQAFRNSRGNSGVQIRSRYDDEAKWLDGPQVDINPSGPWRTGMVWDETRGSKRWLWPVVPKGKWVKREMAMPGMKWKYSDQGDGWNEMTITARGTKLTATVNGVTVLDWDGKGVLDDDVHQKQKVGIKGHIALQIHRNDQLKISFKDIRIRELK